MEGGSGAPHAPEGERTAFLPSPPVSPAPASGRGGMGTASHAPAPLPRCRGTACRAPTTLPRKAGGRTAVRPYTPLPPWGRGAGGEGVALHPHPRRVRRRPVRHPRGNRGWRGLPGELHLSAARALQRRPAASVLAVVRASARALRGVHRHWRARDCLPLARAVLRVGRRVHHDAPDEGHCPTRADPRRRPAAGGTPHLLPQKPRREPDDCRHGAQRLWGASPASAACACRACSKRNATPPCGR
jgi:hypothetical protein